jgi:hypothetical protein
MPGQGQIGMDVGEQKALRKRHAGETDIAAFSSYAFTRASMSALWNASARMVCRASGV